MAWRVWVLSLLVLPVVASAGSIYLNGVKIDGVTNQKFDKASVRIDDQGNVFIDAAGYTATQVSADAKSSPEAAKARAILPTKRYWLVSEQTVQGMAEFDVDVFANGQWVTKVKNTQEQALVELTPHLVQGKNTLVFAAHKVNAGTPKSVRADHVLRVLVGEGQVKGESVFLESTLAKFERSAADTGDHSREVTLVAR